MPDFQLDAPFQPTGDQPQAIAKLVEGSPKGHKQQTLLGATGTGKTLLHRSGHRADRSKPTLVLAHNKTLAAQLYSEFRDFFPDNAVEYFVSATSTTTSPRRTCPGATRTSRRTRRATTRSTSCATRPRGPCSSGADVIIVA